MKINKLISIVVCLVTFFFLFITVETSVCAASEKETIKVGFPPQAGFTIKNADGEFTGYTYDYLKKIAQYTDWKYEFIELDGELNNISTQMLEMLENGELDILGGLVSNDYANEHFALTGTSYGTIHSTLVVESENEVIDELNYRTFDGIRIAALTLAESNKKALHDFCTANNITYEIVDCEDMEEILACLKEKRADAALWIESDPLPDTHIIARFSERSFYFATNTNNFPVLNGLNMALDRISQTDPYFSARTAKKYFWNQVSGTELTSEEKKFIKENPMISVLVPKNLTPLQYFTNDGEMKGISKEVLDLVSEKTGLTFEYSLPESNDSMAQYIKEKQYDIICGISNETPENTYHNIVLSQPYLNVKDIVYYNSTSKTTKTDELRYAAIKGIALPDDVSTENVIYYNSQEESMDAVNRGKADYGHGNEFSVSYYTILNDYRNLITIPQRVRENEYCIGFINESKLLYSIIKKSLSKIDESDLQNIILTTTSNIERKASLKMILYTYGKEISMLVAVIIIALLFGIYYIIKTNKKFTTVLLSKAEYDGLTNIYNSATCKELIRKRLLEKHEFVTDAFLILDIDYFKKINDNLGHYVGDQVLQELSKTLKTVFHPHDIIGRLGGDEFCVYLVDAGSKNRTASQCQKLKESIPKTVENNGKAEKLSISLGGVMVDSHTTFETIYIEADDALYQAKQNGRDCFNFSQ